MIKIVVPGRGELEFSYLVLDYNGTIALDGKIFPEVRPLLHELAEMVEIYILTADTFGTAQAECADLPIQLHLLTGNDHTNEKAEFVRKLGLENVVVVGNGQNDIEMIKAAALGIGVLGPEGCAAGVLQVADLFVGQIRHALELMLNPKRCIATLRK